MSRAGDINHIEIILLDYSIQMHVDEILARRCAPVTHEERLDIVLHKLTAHERIIVQVDLPHGEVVGRTPIGVHLLNEFFWQILSSFHLHVTHRDSVIYDFA